MKKLALFIILLAAACSPDKNEIKKSETKKTNKNSNFRNESSFYLSCTESVGDYPTSKQLIKEITQVIMDANPDVFKKGGIYDPNNFCIEATTENSDAAAKPYRRILMFNPFDLILPAKSVDEIASIIAHELSHITMQHMILTHPKYSGVKSTASDLQKQYEDALVKGDVREESFKKSRDDTVSCVERAGFSGADYDSSLVNILKELHCTLSAGDDSRCPRLEYEIEAELKSNTPESCTVDAGVTFNAAKRLFQISFDLSRIKEVFQSLMFNDPGIGTEEAANWQEREADEIGFNYYMRSGFELGKQNKFFLREAQENLPEEDNPSFTYASCEQILFADMSEKEIKDTLESTWVKRGSNSHPTACWRMLNLKYRYLAFGPEITKNPNLEKQRDFLTELLSQATNEIGSDSFFLQKSKKKTYNFLK